jgi:hypothetical protein
VEYFPIRSAFALIVLALTASPSMAEQWSVTALAAIAKEERRGRGWDEPSLALGFSTGWRLSPSLSFEADVTYVPDMLPDNPIISAKLDVLYLSGTAVYNLTTGKWQPYLAGGMGVGRTHFTQPESGLRFVNPPHWGPGVNVGGGVKRRMRPRTELRADIRYVLIRDISDDVTDVWRAAAGFTVFLRR